ncbi:MAG: ribonuclease HII [Chloroflexota bacterium]
MDRQPSLDQEVRLWSLGFARIAGVDEAGRGARAGPVVAAAVILPPIERQPELATALAPVRDSKLLSPRQRERCYDLVAQAALAYGVGTVSADAIDRNGIVACTRLAMWQAIASLGCWPDYLLIDALSLPDLPLPQVARPKSDRYVLSVAAASIIAKVTRDRLMVRLEAACPGYGLGQHKGYGTAQHRQALARLGPSHLHRHSFWPVRALAEATNA